MTAMNEAKFLTFKINFEELKSLIFDKSFNHNRTRCLKVELTYQ